MYGAVISFPWVYYHVTLVAPRVHSCMVGYINNTLSIARVSDQDISKEFLPSQMITHGGVNVSSCRFVFPLFLILIYFPF